MNDSVEQLYQFLRRYLKDGPRPVLWVGAGASAAAGYPTLPKLESLIRAEMPGATETGFALLDRYISEFGRADLANLLQRHLGVPRGPAAIHEALARLLEARVFGLVSTTNYDRLIEQALTALRVPHTVQVLEQNFVLSARQDVPVLKLHGDQGDWLSVVLTTASYAEFERTYPLLQQQLNLSLRTHPVVFVGCSLRDPRVLGWLRSLPPTQRTTLFASRVLITGSDWEQIPESDRALLTECNVRPVCVEDYVAITRTLQELATKLAPLPVHELVFTLTPGEESWTIVGPTSESTAHQVPNPLRDESLLAKLSKLRKLASSAIVDGHPAYTAPLAEGRTLSRELGEKLTTVLCSADAKIQVVRRLHDKERGRARLVLRVLDAPDPALRTLTERALALPWELLMLEPDQFAVERSELDVVREIVKDGSPVVPEPTTALQVAIAVSAPEDQVALKYEEESLRLQQALGPLGHSAAFAEMGTVEDMVSLAEKRSPQALHFSGHGLPGKLVFEDEFGCSKRVAVDDLVAALNTRLTQSGTERRFPSLFFLASCHGVSGTGTTEPTAGTREAEALADRQARDLATALGEGPSTAATLHRAGFAQVLGYFGPVSDALCTRAEAVFYKALAQGKTTLQATSECRQSLREPFKHGEAQVRYPLAWIQLALYHRGPDRPLAIAGTETLVKPQWRDEVVVSGLPVLQHGFIGRRSLLHKIRNLVRAGQRLLLLHGVGGVGKTALATHLLRSVLSSDDRDLLILCCRPLKESADPVGALWGQAAVRARELGVSDESLRKLREQTEDAAQGFEKTVELLRQKRPKLVIYVDNMEDLQVAPKEADAAHALGSWRPGVAPWWERVERLSHGGLVLASLRYRFDGPPDDFWVGVEPLRPADTQRLIDTFSGLQGLTEQDKQTLGERSDGHPRTVVFVEQLLSQKRKNRLGSRVPGEGLIDDVLGKTHDKITEDLMLQALWSCLSAEAQQHARTMSVLRRPIPAPVVEELGEAAVALRDSSLLIPTRHLGVKNGQPDWRERWDMLGGVAEFVAAQPPQPDWKAVHKAVGLALKTHVASSSDDRLWSDQEEAIHHLHSAQEGDLAWPLVEEYVIRLRERAQYREAHRILSQCEAVGTTSDRLARAFVLSDQMLEYLGRGSDRSVDQLERALVLAQRERTKAAVHQQYGDLLQGRGNHTKAEMHLRISLTLSENSDGIENPTYATTLHALAGLLESQGKYEEAEAFFREAMKIADKTLGNRSAAYAACLHGLAGILQSQRKFAEAEILLSETLRIFEDLAATNHPDFSAALNNLAGVMRERGRIEQAEVLLRRSLAIKQELGITSPAYFTSLHNLLDVLFLQGKYAEAETLLRRSLAIDEKALGVEHPDYGASLHALAGVLESQGKYAEAETLLRRSLAIDEKALGVEHPDYGASLHALAGVLESQGKYAEAETLLRRSLAIDEKALGVEHPDYGASLHALAGVLESQGKYAEAETLLRRSLAIDEKALGVEHPDYGASLHALAGVLESQGKYAEAETLLRRSLAIDEKALGVEHPDYGASLHALAGVLESQGKYAEAETLLRRSLAIDEKALGVEHPDYGASLHALAGVLESQGKYAEAETLLRRSLAIDEKALGVEHPDYGASLHALAGVLESQGKYAEAETLLRRSLAIDEKALGVEHPDYGASLHALAGVLESQGKYAEAETLLRRSLALKEKALGVEHPSTYPTLSNLAVVLAQQSKASDGLPLLHRAHAIATKVHGPVHPDVGQILNLLAQVQAALRLPDAPKTSEQAVSILAQCLGPDHPLTQGARQFHQSMVGANPSQSATPDFEDVLGQIIEQAKSGQLSEATTAMTQLADHAAKAAAQHPEAISRFFLAQFHAAASNQAAARADANRSRELAQTVGDDDLLHACDKLLSQMEPAK